MDNEQLKKMENDPSNPEKESSRKTGNDVAESSEATTSQKPGAILAARRIASGISEEQIASRLKMSVRQVRSLEADDYEALHGMATARGFVRAYARVLQLDPEPLVASFSDKKKSPSPASATQGKSSAPFVKNRDPFRKKRGTSVKIAILLIIVVGVLVVASNMKFFSFMEMFRKESAEKATPKITPVPTVAPAPETKETVPAVDQTQMSENKPADQAVVNAAGQTNMTGQANPANTPVQTPAIQNASMTTAQATSTKGSSLVINFRQKSWLQVQKKDGSVVAEFIGKPGEKRQLDITEPVTVIVGFAPGVNMEFRGAPVDLVSNTNNSVAKVTLK